MNLNVDHEEIQWKECTSVPTVHWAGQHQGTQAQHHQGEQVERGHLNEFFTS
jgi:hypothetical protein